MGWPKLKTKRSSFEILDDDRDLRPRNGSHGSGHRRHGRSSPYLLIDQKGVAESAQKSRTGGRAHELSSRPRANSAGKKRERGSSRGRVRRASAPPPGAAARSAMTAARSPATTPVRHETPTRRQQQQQQQRPSALAAEAMAHRLRGGGALSDRSPMQVSLRPLSPRPRRPPPPPPPLYNKSELDVIHAGSGGGGDQRSSRPARRSLSDGTFDTRIYRVVNRERSPSPVVVFPTSNDGGSRIESEVDSLQMRQLSVENQDLKRRLNAVLKRVDGMEHPYHPNRHQSSPRPYDNLAKSSPRPYDNVSKGTSRTSNMTTSMSLRSSDVGSNEHATGIASGATGTTRSTAESGGAEQHNRLRQKHYEHLRRERDEARTEAARLRAELDAERGICGVSKLQISSSDSEGSSDGVEGPNDELRRLRAQVEGMREDLKQCRLERDESRYEAKRYKDEARTALDELSEAKKKAQDDGSEQDAAKLRDDVVVLKLRLEDAQHNLEQCEAERELYKLDADKYKSEIDSVRESSSELEAARDELKKSRKSLQAVQFEKAKLVQETDQLKEQLKDTRINAKRYRHDAKAAVQAAEKLENKLKHRTEEVTQAKRSLNEQIRKVVALELQLDTAKDELGDALEVRRKEKEHQREDKKNEDKKERGSSDKKGESKIHQSEVNSPDGEKAKENRKINHAPSEKDKRSKTNSSDRKQGEKMKDSKYASSDREKNKKRKKEEMKLKFSDEDESDKKPSVCSKDDSKCISKSSRRSADKAMLKAAGMSQEDMNDSMVLEEIHRSEWEEKERNLKEELAKVKADGEKSRKEYEKKLRRLENDNLRILFGKDVAEESCGAEHSALGLSTTSTLMDDLVAEDADTLDVKAGAATFSVPSMIPIDEAT